MKLSDSEILVARQSALVGLKGGGRRLITKGELLHAGDPIVQGREHLFAPAASRIVAASSSLPAPAKRKPPAKPPAKAAAKPAAKPAAEPKAEKPKAEKPKAGDAAAGTADK